MCITVSYTHLDVYKRQVHVRYYVYEPKVVLRVKGIVQIHHGLGEHADNYDHFASCLLYTSTLYLAATF